MLTGKTASPALRIERVGNGVIVSEHHGPQCVTFGSTLVFDSVEPYVEFMREHFAQINPTQPAAPQNDVERR